LKKDDASLREQLAKEKKTNSIAYQVLSYREDMVQDTIDFLLLLGTKTPDTPEGKKEINDRINQITVEVERLQRDLAKKNQERKIAVQAKIKEKNDLNVTGETLRKKENLLTILRAMTDSSDTTARNREILLEEKNPDGTYKKAKLDSITGLTINDYAGANLFIAKKDSSGNDTNEPADDLGAGKKVTGSLFDLLRSSTNTSAKGILDAEDARPHAEAYQPYYQTTVDDS